MLRPRQDFPTPLFQLVLFLAAAILGWVVSLWFR
jgi:hypothetical protein